MDRSGKRNILLGWPNNNKCGFFCTGIQRPDSNKHLLATGIATKWQSLLEAETDYIHSQASSLHNFEIAVSTTNFFSYS